jgi:hypothetical protein
LYAVSAPADNDGDGMEHAMQTERPGTNPSTTRKDHPAWPQIHRMPVEDKLDEALKETFPASDAFVVAWDPRALDSGTGGG